MNASVHGAFSPYYSSVKLSSLSAIHAIQAASSSCPGDEQLTFLELAAPPVDGNVIAFGSVLMPAPASCDSNVGWIGRLVCDLWHFLCKIGPSH